jgi:hypothetical protein
MQISQITYGGLAEAGIPTTGQGRSLGFLKKHYLATGGLRILTPEQNGDDMFLVLSIAKRRGRAVLCPSCPVLHPPERTLGAFLQQRIRWSAAGKIHFHRLSWKAKSILLNIILVNGCVYWDLLVRKSPWSLLFKFAVDTALLWSGRRVFRIDWKLWPLFYMLQHLYFPVVVVGGLFRLVHWPKRDNMQQPVSEWSGADWTFSEFGRFVFRWLYKEPKYK